MKINKTKKKKKIGWKGAIGCRPLWRNRIRKEVFIHLYRSKKGLYWKRYRQETAYQNCCLPSKSLNSPLLESGLFKKRLIFEEPARWQFFLSCPFRTKWYGANIGDCSLFVLHVGPIQPFQLGMLEANHLWVKVPTNGMSVLTMSLYRAPDSSAGVSDQQSEVRVLVMTLVSMSKLKSRRECFPH